MSRCATVSLPLDVWLPSSEIVKPQFSQQVANVGYYHNFLKGMIETSVEGYYKDMRNLVEFADGADPAQSINDNIDHTLRARPRRVVRGGILHQKSQRQIQGRIGYTLAWTFRKFRTQQRQALSAKYDRLARFEPRGCCRPQLPLVVRGHIRVASGNTLYDAFAVVFLSKTSSSPNLANAMPTVSAYHRLDLSATYPTYKLEKEFKSSVTLSVYNVYSRQNPYFIYYDREEISPTVPSG